MRISILLVEDEPGDVELIREMLGANRDISYKLTISDRCSRAVEVLNKERIDIVLMDLGLPDSQGMDTLLRVLDGKPDVPIIVMTGNDNEAQAAKAVQMGAQDYLIKGQIDQKVLQRSIRYGLERYRLLKELELARLRKEQEREIRSLDEYSDGLATSVTARSFGVGLLSETIPDSFEELVSIYGDLLDLSLEQRTFKVDNTISKRLYSLAEKIGFLKAGPRDIVEIHSLALKRRTTEVPPQRAQAFMEEGRLMVLELMGYLVSVYRANQSRIPAQMALTENKRN